MTDRSIKLVAWLTAILCLAWAAPGAAWNSDRSSISSGLTTHDYILDRAYDTVAADPAFDPQTFPTKKEILKYEGIDSEGNGQGPDGKLNSTLADHYYNRRANLPTALLPKPVYKSGSYGKARSNVSNYSGRMAKGMLQGLRGVPRAATYAAHYLADLWVPFHVIGIDKKAAEMVHGLFTGAGKPVELKQSIVGREVLCYKCLTKKGRDFTRELDYYLTAAAKDKRLDYFDPWLLNGYTAVTSSHNMWESAAQKLTNGLSPTKISAYDRRWRNHRKGRPTGNHTSFGFAAYDYAEAISQHVDTHQDRLINNPIKAIEAAVSSVATLWRASFSGLRLSTNLTKIENGLYKISAGVENKAAEDAQEVRLHFLPPKDKVELLDAKESDPATVTFPELRRKGGKAGLKKGWVFKYSGKETITINLAATCGFLYKHFPDLRYAGAKHTITGQEKPEYTGFPRFYKGKAKVGFKVVRTGPNCKSQGGYTKELEAELVLEGKEEGNPGKVSGYFNFIALTTTGQGCGEIKETGYPHPWKIVGTHDGSRKFSGKFGWDKPLIPFTGTFSRDRIKGRSTHRETRSVGEFTDAITYSVEFDLPKKKVTFDEPGPDQPRSDQPRSDRARSDQARRLRNILKRSKTE